MRQFTAGNLFPSHSCIGVTQVKPPPGFEPRSPHERWTTYQVRYPSPLTNSYMIFISRTSGHLQYHKL